MARREPTQALLMVNPGTMTEAKACQTNESTNPTATAAFLLLSSANCFLFAFMAESVGENHFNLYGILYTVTAPHFCYSF